MNTMKESVGDKPSGGGLRYNSGKMRWSLLSIPALMELIKVLEFGAKKYDSWNWSKGMSWTETYDCLLRHMQKWMAGEDRDDETGLSHLAHAMCNAMFLLHFIVTGTGKDDRPPAQRNEGTIGNDNHTSNQQFTGGCGASDSMVKCGLPDVQADVRPSDGEWRERCY